MAAKEFNDALFKKDSNSPAGNVDTTLKTDAEVADAIEGTSTLIGNFSDLHETHLKKLLLSANGSMLARDQL